MKTLRRAQFGNPILRQIARRLDLAEITDNATQELIAAMHNLLTSKKYGVGLAAPQVGRSLAIVVIDIQPTDYRPNVQPQMLTVINPEIITTYGRKQSLWEGCLSLGGSRDTVFAKVPRYTKVRVRFYDQHAKLHERDVEGLLAQLFQHEIDHLNGILFVDRVIDTKSYVTMSEYKKRYRSRKQ